MTCSNDFGGDRVGHGAVDGHDGSGGDRGSGLRGRYQSHARLFELQDVLGKRHRHAVK